MGEVFAAENIRTGRPVAVKLLRADSKSKASAVARFRREARAAGSINSDHVTQVLDVEDDAEHGIVIVFELLEGESLIDRLKRSGPIPFDVLHPIIEEVWVGLCDAHKVGIIHRDLKPSNVFLERRPDGQLRVKILDFGISKLPKEMGGETLTEMGQSLGTFSFMPPEQIGRAKTVDHRADIYATTTMIYQSLTGQLPYVARNILVMVELKSKTDPRPLSEAMGHQVDRALETFVSKGLARNPADRFPNALDALEEWRKLKSLQVPESRRAVSGADLNSQAVRAASGPQPAAGRPATGGYNQARPTTSPYLPPSSGAPSSGMSPPAPVVPAAMLEPVLPGAMPGSIPASLPRLYDQTESTTDVSRIEMIGTPAMQEALAAGSKSTMPSAAAQRQELRSDGERQGPAGTRVLPQSVVQQAVAVANARNASKAEALAAAQNAQGQHGHGPQGQPQGQQPARNASQPDLRSGSHPVQSPQSGPAQSGPYAAAAMSGSSAPPPPASSMGGQVPSSGSHPSMRQMGGPDPHGQAPVQSPQMQNPSSGVHPSARNVGQSDPRISSQPPVAGHGQQAVNIQAKQGPPQLSTLRLPDEPSSVPGSQDKTQIYRPTKGPVPQKKRQSLALFVVGAIAFAIVGFGIVYVVQLLVRAAQH